MQTLEIEFRFFDGDGSAGVSRVLLRKLLNGCQSSSGFVARKENSMELKLGKVIRKRIKPKLHGDFASGYSFLECLNFR